MTGAHRDVADFVIVGTGAGGATAARVLAAAGHDVLMLEEGPQLSPQERARALLEAMGQSVRDLATTATDGVAPIPLLQGRCVGGSTAINSGIIWRTPEAVRQCWRDDYGLHDWVGEPLDAAFERLESELGVAVVDPSVLGGNARLMARGADALGLPGRVMRRNAPGCRGRARCLQGCPEGARSSMDVSYVPQAMADGARLCPGFRVARVRFAGHRAVAVEGQRSTGQAFVVHARQAVILAAGAVHSPHILLRSGLRGRTGHGFQAHPGLAIVARFDGPVGMGFGASQAFEVPLPEERMKLESISLPPELLAARLPGAGPSWQRHLSNLDHYAQWCGILRMEARGRVRRGRFGAPRVSYVPTRADEGLINRAAQRLIELLFAAGAREVFPGIAGLPAILTHADQVRDLDKRHIRQRDVHLMASHHFASLGAGTRDDSVVDGQLRVRGADGLFVMDASVLPTNLGVNPQHTIMGIVMLAAERLAHRAQPASTRAA